MNIFSPMATGNGAFIVHKQLASCINGYSLRPYSPNLTFFPPALALIGCKHPDIIHTVADYGLFFKKNNSKLILTFHNYVLDSFMRKHSSFLQRVHYRTDLKTFTKLSVRRASSLSAVSKFTAEIVKRDLGIEQDIRVIYNGIDESSFTPVKQKNTKKILTVLFSGNISKRKGFDFIPRLLPFLNKNIRILYTTGLRSSRPVIDSDRIKCVGSVAHEGMPGLYQMADILIFPSVREGFGLSVAEAMSCGLPVVAFNSSSIPELIDHGLGGYLTDIHDAKKFAEYINILGESSRMRLQMGDYNRSKVEEKFTQSRMINNYQQYFEEILSM